MRNLHLARSGLWLSFLLFLLSACEAVEDPVYQPTDAQPQRIPEETGVRSDADADVACLGGEPASGELCNGKDDDCDGVIDEGFMEGCGQDSVCQNDDLRQCETDCGWGSQTCVNGAWAPCDVSTPNQESCNNADDDCDGEVDEGLICQELDRGVDAGPVDAGAVDAATPVDAEPDAQIIDMLPPDAGPPPCQGNAVCPGGELCLTGRCVDSLPGTFEFVMLSVRYTNEVVDPLGGSPDIYAELLVNGVPEGRTPAVSGRNGIEWRGPEARFEVFLDRRADLEICVLDEDGFLKGGDDDVGCIRFDALDVVDRIQNFDMDRPANSPHLAFVTIRPMNMILTELNFSVERIFRRR